MPQTKFAALSRLLTELGFVMRVDPKFIRFDNVEANAWFLFPAYGEEEEVALSDLVGTRHILDAKGMLPREQFEERLRSIPVARLNARASPNHSAAAGVRPRLLAGVGEDGRLAFLPDPVSRSHDDARIS
jgi:hypothetical protein